jgi:hypothetical protein
LAACSESKKHYHGAEDKLDGDDMQFISFMMALLASDNAQLLSDAAQQYLLARKVDPGQLLKLEFSQPLQASKQCTAWCVPF